MEQDERELGFETERLGRIPRSEILSLLWSLFRTRILHFGGAFLLLVVASGLVLVGPILVKRAIDVNISGRDLEGLRATVLLYLGAQLLRLGVFYAMRNWLEWAGQELMASLKRSLFDHLMALPLSFYDKNPPGRLISRVENDTASLRMLFTTTSVMLLGDLLLFVGMFVVMALVSLRLTLVLLTMIPIIVVVALRFQRRTHPLFLAARRYTADICARLAEFIHGMPVIQAYARRRWATRNFQSLNFKKFEAEYRGDRLWLIWFNLVIFAETISFALILSLGGYWALKGIVTIGTLAMFMAYVRRFFEPILRLSDQFAIIQKAFAGAERIFLLLREPLVVADPRQPVAWTGLTHSVSFENVSFRYGEDGDWVVRDVSFTLPAGERWAVVGPTGAGKTTLVSLLLRFYDPVEGRIRMDGHDLRELSQREIRSRVGLVLQDLYLFPGDLEANLTLDRDGLGTNVREAARLTQADRLIEGLPDGYSTTLSERGANLSQGERQLLSFTRAIVHEPSLLVLDEATSSVDPATEAEIEGSLGSILEGRTALIIAHRLSTIRSCDRILVMDGGKIVEAGTHEELLSQGGLYQTLHALQFKEDGRAAEVAS